MSPNVRLRFAVSKRWCTGLIFVEPDAKVDGTHYQDVVFRSRMSVIQFNSKVAYLPIELLRWLSDCVQRHQHKSCQPTVQFTSIQSSTQGSHRLSINAETVLFIWRTNATVSFLMTAAATLKLRLRSSVAVLGTARSPRSRFPRTKTGSAREIRRGHERNPVDYNVLGVSTMACKTEDGERCGSAEAAHWVLVSLSMRQLTNEEGVSRHQVEQLL